MVHSYIPCRSRLALRTTSEKSPLTKSALSQLKPSFIWVAAFPNEAISEPFFIQLTAIRDWFMLSPSAESVTLQGRVAFVFGLAWISLEDTESRERWTEKNKTGIIKAPYFSTWGLVRCNVPFLCGWVCISGTPTPPPKKKLCYRQYYVMIKSCYIFNKCFQCTW